MLNKNYISINEKDTFVNELLDGNYQQYYQHDTHYFYKKVGESAIDIEYSNYIISFKIGWTINEDNKLYYYIVPIIDIIQSPSEKVSIKIEMSNKFNTIQDVEVFANKIFNCYNNL